MTLLPLLWTAAILAAAPLPSQQPQGQPAAAGDPPAGQIVLPGVRRLTIGGQYRLRYENQIDYDFDRGTDSAASNDFFTQRLRVNLDFDLGDELRAFFQLQDAREWGEESSTIDDAADGFDLHQGWVELRKTPGFGGSARLGRQEIAFGDHRLVGNLDWRTGARSFDGVRQTWSREDGSLDVFAVQTRELLNTANDDAAFGGIYGSKKLGERASGDLYLLYLHDDGTAPGLSQNRFTLGARVGAQPGAWDLGIELATQSGEDSGADIPFAETWAGHVHVQHRWEDGCRPWIKVAFDAASGNDPATADDERFDNLFPTAHAHWGMMDLAQWENLENPWAQVGASLCERTDASLAWHFFRAMEAGDGFRGPNGTLSAGNPAFSRTMGHEIDLLLTRRLDLGAGIKSALQLGYAVFLPGGGVKDAKGSDDPAHFVYLQFDLRF
jgi:hypothetical protein